MNGWILGGLSILLLAVFAGFSWKQSRAEKKEEKEKKALEERISYARRLEEVRRDAPLTKLARENQQAVK